MLPAAWRPRPLDGGITVDELLTEWAARLPAPADTELPGAAPKRRLFIGMGHSGQGDLSERVKELRREVAAEEVDDDRRADEG